MRRRWWIIAVVVVLGGFLALLFFGPREPSYEGKTLSYWLQASERDADRPKAKAAIAAMGTDAVPFLKLMLRSDPHRLRFRIEARFRELFHMPFPRNSSALKDPDSQHASFGFIALGATGVPALIDFLGDYDPEIRQSAIGLLGTVGEKSQEATPKLLKILATSKVPGDRHCAAQALGQIGSTPEITQALTAALDDSEPEVRLFAALGLGRYDYEKTPIRQTMDLFWGGWSGGGWDGQGAVGSGGIHSSATNALPQLNQKLQDMNKKVRAAAKFAIEQIQGTNAVVTPKEKIYCN